MFEKEDFWCYVPVMAMDTNACSHDFKSENFGRAIKFRPQQDVYLMENFDTLRIKGSHGSRSTLQIMPVIMDYNAQDSGIGEDTFKVETDDGNVLFNYVEGVVEIKSITPLFCYQRRKSDVKACECERNENDKYDYLFKVCKYLKSKGDVSFQPCKYKIAAVSKSKYNGREAIEVNLDCCYLGDRAYFDPITNELISFSYGAE